MNRAKFFRPTIGTDIVQRIRLWNLLEEGSRLPITLISAPAGYGKSTLVSSWLNQKDRPFIWISLEKEDSDLSVFLRNFIRGVRQLRPDFGYRLEALLETPQPTSFEKLSSEFINTISQFSEELIMVFDDYHLLDNQLIHRLISNYLKFPNQHFHLVLCSRSDPAIQIQDYRSKGWLIEIRSRDLIFSDEEIIDFLSAKKIEDLKEVDLRNIYRITEGWATGIRLLTFQNGGTQSFKERILEYNKSDLFYIEIVENYISKSPSLKEFMMMTSCLDQFDAELCCHIASALKMELKDIKDNIETLINDNFFIIPLDDNNYSFRFHHLIRKHLYKQTQRTWSKEKISRIHCAAGDWYKDQNKKKLAIEQYIYGSNYKRGIDLFKDYRLQLHKEMDWNTLEHFIRLFPENISNDSPEIQLSKAWLKIYTGDVFEMFAMIDPIEELLRNKKSTSQALEAEWKSLLVYKIYNISQDYDKCIEACSYAIQHLPKEHVYALGYSWIFLGGALQIKIGTAEAVKRIKQGIAGVNDDTVNSHQWLVICYLYWISGENNLLIKSSRSLIELGHQSNNMEALANGYSFQGKGYFAQADFKKAEASLLKFYDIRYNTIAVIHFMGMVALCKCSYDLGKKAQVQGILDDLDDLVHIQKDLYFSQVLNVLKAELSSRNGYNKLALAQIKKLEEVPLVPLTDFFHPQIIMARILLRSDSKSDLKMAGDLISQLEDLIYRTKNDRFLIDLLLLKSELELSQGEQKLAGRYATRAIQLANVNRNISPFIEIRKPLQTLVATKSQREFPGFYSLLTKFLSSPKFENKDQFPSNREIEVLKLIRENLSNKQIANTLFISEKTVKRHCGNLFKNVWDWQD